MNTTASPFLVAASTPPPASADDTLREALKRCPPSTLEAALAFHRTGDHAHVPVIVLGIIARFAEREHRGKLLAPSAVTAELRLVTDLGLDSLTLMEIVLLAEDVLPVTINNEELRHLRTIGDVQTFIDCKLRGLPLPPSLCQPATPASAAPSTANL